MALIAALAVVGAIAITSALLLGQGSTPTVVKPSTGAKPLDPVGAPPTPAADLAGRVSDGRVTWSWRPSAEPGARYHVTLTRPGRPPVQQRPTAPTLEIEAGSGENCIEVVVTGADGRPSDPAKACVTVP